MNLVQLHTPEGITSTVRDVTLKSGDRINTLLVSSASESEDGVRDKKTMVLVHGWGAGLGFYSKILGELVDSGYNVILVDLLGMGASSRPKYPRKGDVDECVSFFVESLREVVEEFERDDGVCLREGEWYLVGHSLGAYLSAEYCLKYPEGVRGLVMISPAGVAGRQKGLEEFMKELTWRKRALFRIAVKLWEANVTPQGVMRGFGRGLTERFCLNYVTKRFEGLLNGDEVKVYAQYLCEISLGQGSGEFALCGLLQPFAYAKRPLVERLQDIRCGTAFVYGEPGNDWMDSRAAEVAVRNMREVPTMIAQVKDAGHFVFIDNPKGCTEAILESCRVVEGKQVNDRDFSDVQNVRVYA